MAISEPVYDLIVVGAGPAGLAGARAARAAGLNVALLERDRLGGNSLNAGSVPSKSIIRSGRAFAPILDSREFGAPSGAYAAADFAAVMSRMRRIRSRLSGYCSIEKLLDEGIDVFFCDASFVGEKCLSAGAVELRFEKALIATGARPSPCTIPGLEETGHRTSSTIFDIDVLPKRLGVIGGGPLGCELAQAFAHLGSHVTILQNEPKFLPLEERDAAELLSLSLSRSGVDTRLNTQVVGVRSGNGEKYIDAELNGVRYSVAVDEILLSVGRVANTEELNLGAAGVGCAADGGVQVDDFLRTANSDVYAAGDVCMAQKFANVAEASGRMAVLNAFGTG